MSRVGNDIRAGFGKLMAGLARGKAVPAGEPLTVYHDIIDEASDGDVEVGAPVGDSFAGDGEVGVRTLEGGRMATTVHRGPYDDIGPAYHALMSWIPEHGFQIAGPPREFYLNDPRSVAPADLLTRIEFPIADAAGD